MTVHLKPSRQLAVLLIVAHCAVVPVVWLTPLAYTIKCILLLLLMVSLYYYLNQDALLHSSDSIVSLKLTGARHCEVEMRNGARLECIISGLTYVSAYLTVLILEPVQHRALRSAVILSDSAEKEEFRRLRIMLRWKWNQI